MHCSALTSPQVSPARSMAAVPRCDDAAMNEDSAPRMLPLVGGGALPAFGLGTWRMGEDDGRRGAEVAAVRQAIALGYRLIDTAEMYGEGGAEKVVGQAVAEALRAGDVAREDLTIVSKVYPHNASRRGTIAAFDRSRQRLQLDRIDVYLLHWRGEHPLSDTAAAMQALAADGRIGHWGVSNFDVDDLDELARATDPAGAACAANQVYFSLGERGAEYELLPTMQSRRLPLMAYSPVDQGTLARSEALAAIAAPLHLSAAQLALAWVLSRPGVCAIPKAVQGGHLRDNLAASRTALSRDTLAALDLAFPPPRRRTPLAMT
jgi:diketogulonate reductase-like aldo/keto reductase